MFFFLLMAQAAPKAPAPTADQRLKACLDYVAGDPVKGEAVAAQWRVQGGGIGARQCLAVAYGNNNRWAAAAGTFEDAAREAETAKDERAGNLWALAGNAWIAAGDFAKARAALDAALASTQLTGLALGEARLDRARALVALGQNEQARTDLDAALGNAASDPLAWLLSATLARRTGDLDRAHKDIAQALRLSADDPSVQLEAGNIAAASGDEPGARSAWNRVLTLAPATPTAESARKALAQFGSTER